jgi:hypothetical protein
MLKREQTKLLEKPPARKLIAGHTRFNIIPCHGRILKVTWRNYNAQYS